MTGFRRGPPKISSIVLSSSIMGSPRKDFCSIWIGVEIGGSLIWGKTEESRYNTPTFPCFIVNRYIKIKVY